jgi:hypothetical protein
VSIRQRQKSLEKEKVIGAPLVSIDPPNVPRNDGSPTTETTKTPYPERTARHVVNTALIIEFIAASCILILCGVLYDALGLGLGPQCEDTSPSSRRFVGFLDAALPFHAARWIGLLHDVVFDFWEFGIWMRDGENPVTSDRYRKYLRCKFYSEIVVRVVTTAVFFALFWGKGVFTLQCL